jgi:hypothetical protein
VQSDINGTGEMNGNKNPDSSKAYYTGFFIMFKSKGFL